jgi:thiamine-phosphate pyrophosphorylase
MFRGHQMTNPKPVTQMCLQFAAPSDAKASVQRLSRALDVAAFSSVILSGPPGQPIDAAAAHPLVELLQSRGIAALIHGDAALARALRADGVHVAWVQNLQAAYTEAREILGTRFIVGADAGRSRHDAMQLAETGADYVGFGIPAHVEDRATASERRFDLAAWWAEIFEVPVMVLDVETADDVAALGAARADFVAITLPFTLPAREFETQVLALTSALGVKRVVSSANL